MLLRDPSDTLEAMRPADVGWRSGSNRRQAGRGFYGGGGTSRMRQAMHSIRCWPTWHARCRKNVPLIWLGCAIAMPRWKKCRLRSLCSEPNLLPAALQYSLSPEAYRAKVEAVRALIERGETYQANLTMDATWTAGGRCRFLVSRACLRRSRCRMRRCCIRGRDGRWYRSRRSCFSRATGTVS